ncbi:MAG TPA: glycosyltransferase family 39 protein, partial [Myxococcota bacterium]|nr:glycosyltransferase family 39 protein [Myxococcota bacterium]
ARRRERLLVLVASALLLLPGLGRLGLWAPDEPRYAQVAEELRSFVHGPSGLVVLHLNGDVYDQKPPLYFWAAALAGLPGGRVTEQAARLPSALAGIACVALTMRLGALLLSPRASVLGALFLLTSLDFARLSRRVQLDVVLTLFELVALYAFVRLEQKEGSRTGNLLWLHAALGLAVLTKGPVGFLPLLVMAVALAFDGRLAALRGLFPAWSPLLSLAPPLAWLAAAATLAPAGFFDAAVVQNLWGRVAEGTAHPRPFYYYAYQFPIDFLPWSLVWPLVPYVARRKVFAGSADPERGRAWRFLLSWVATTFVVFSLFAGKRGLYLAPAAPAAALLSADALLLFLLERGTLPRAFSWLAFALAASLFAVGVRLALFPQVSGVSLPWTFGAAVATIAAGGAAAWGWLGRGDPTPPHVGSERATLRRIGVAVAGAFALLASAFHLLYPSLDDEKSPRPVALAAAALVPQGEPIGLLGSSPLVGGLVYYAGRPILELDSPLEARAFLARGGRAIVLEAKKLDRLNAVVPVQVRSRARADDRTLLVVIPSGEVAQGPLAPAPPALPP